MDRIRGGGGNRRRIIHLSVFLFCSCFIISIHLSHTVCIEMPISTTRVHYCAVISLDSSVDIVMTIKTILEYLLSILRFTYAQIDHIEDVKY